VSPTSTTPPAAESARRRSTRQDEFDALDQLVARRGSAARPHQMRQPPGGEARPEILLIDVDLLHADPQQPRKAVSAGGIDELARSIFRFGLLSALTVTPDRLTPLGQTYRVVAGERRLRALKRLVDGEGHERFRRVPCIVSHGERADQMLAALAENLQREDLSPLEEAEFTRALKQESGKSTAELAEALSLTESWVQQRLQIAEALSPEARDVLIEWQRAAVGDAYAPAELAVHGKPSFSFLRRLAFAPREVQADAARVVRERGYTARGAEAYVREVVAASTPQDGARHRRGKRLARRFEVTPPGELALSAQQRTIPVHTAAGPRVLSLGVVDVRGLNVVQLVRYAERRAWLVDPDEFRRDLEAAATADMACLADLIDASVSGRAPSDEPPADE
jgi:ParB/RepB/Spo0J family partition protein